METVKAKRPIPNSILDMMGGNAARLPDVSNNKDDLVKVLQLIQSRMDMMERNLDRMIGVRGSVFFPGLRGTTSRMELGK